MRFLRSFTRVLLVMILWHSTAQALLIRSSIIGQPSGGTTAPGCVQLNFEGRQFACSANYYWDDSTNTLVVVGTVAATAFVGAGSGVALQLNGTPYTALNVIDTPGSATVAPIGWVVDTAPSPDTATAIIGPATATQAGMVTAEAQDIGGLKHLKDGATIGNGGPDYVANPALTTLCSPGQYGTKVDVDGVIYTCADGQLRNIIEPLDLESAREAGQAFTGATTESASVQTCPGGNAGDSGCMQRWSNGLGTQEKKRGANLLYLDTNEPFVLLNKQTKEILITMTSLGQVCFGPLADACLDDTIVAAGTGDISAVGTCTTGACFTSETTSKVLASPNGSTGAMTPRALVDNDIPDTITASNYLPLAGGTLTGQLVASNLGVEFTESDTNPACAAGNYSISADASEGKLKACQNGTLSDLLTVAGGGGDITDVGNCTTGACFTSETTNKVLASPNGSTGPMTARALVAADIPALSYQPLDAALTALAGGSDFVQFTGPSGSIKAFALPNAPAAILTDNAAVTVAQGGTGLASGTSGGVPYFSGTTTIASSAALPVNGVVIGGGAGAAPTGIAASTTTTQALFATAGAPAFRALTDADIPDTITCSNYQPLDAALTALAGGSDFVRFTGPSSTIKDFALPNNPATILTSDAAVTVAQGGTGIASGTSGGIPYYSGSTTIASSAALPVNGVVIGGGAGATPTGIAASTTTTHALMATAGAPAFRALTDADIPDTITASNYLPLAGGALTGGLTYSGSGKPYKTYPMPPAGWKAFGAAVVLTDTALISGGLAEDFLRVTSSTSDGFHRRFGAPDGWDGGNVLVQTWGVCARTSCAGNLVLSFSALCIQDGDSDTTTITTTGAGQATLTWSAQNQNKYAISAAVTPQGTCTAPVALRVQVKVVSATLDAAELLETGLTTFQLKYKRSADTD